MRGVPLLLAIAFFLSAPIALALDTDLAETYQPRETIITKVTGSIATEIDESQIVVKRNNIFVPIEYGVGRVGNSWYVWLVAPQNANTYTFILENVQMQSGVLEDYRKNFTVEGEEKEYTVTPGILIKSRDFEIDVQVNDDDSHTFNVDYPAERAVTVNPGPNDISFNSTDPSPQEFTFVQVGDYSLPAYIPARAAEVTQNQTQQNSSSNSSSQPNQTSNSIMLKPEISVSPAYVQKFMFDNNEEKTYTFTVQNQNNLSHKNLRIFYNSSLFDVDDDEFNLGADANYSFDLILDESASGNISERIIINGTNVSIEIPFILRLTDNATSVAAFYGEIVNNGTNGTIRRSNSLCSEFGALVCSSGSVCSGEVVEGRDGQCCLGICAAPESKSYAWIGWLIAFAVLGAGWFAYYKYKKAGPA